MDQTVGGATGSGFEVSPNRLKRNAARFASLGDTYRERASGAQIPPLPLGPSPPAMWFANRIAEVAGEQQGIRSLLDKVAGNLTAISRRERETARDYRGVDDTNAATLTYPEAD